MAKPKRTFSGQEGQRSVGTAGPEGISYDLDNLFAALDPDDTFKDGTPGGVGEENFRTGSISDHALGERTVDQSKSPSSNTGLLTNVLSWFGNMIKKITGETNWFDTPATTLKAAKTHIDANAPHSGHINAINNIQGGNITLKAGTNVEISQNTATKEVTIATSGTIAPSAHASSHAIGGADRITPAMIGAASIADIPSGIIVMWSGSISNIPSGWALCNGSNGTPDLRNRFVVGAGSSYSVGNTGGAQSVTLTTAQIPAHNHTASSNSTGAHTHSGTTSMNKVGDQHVTGSIHTVTGWRDESANVAEPLASSWGALTHINPDPINTNHSHAFTTSPNGSHSHTITVNNTGSGQSHENRPPYYALAYIMKL
jgi:microcystin-dependent protein